MNSRLVIFILIIYILLICKTLYDFYNSVLSNSIVGGNELAYLVLIGLNYILTYYGSFIGVIIGFSSIMSERNNGALKCLIVKPVYRDTIINGKLIGSFGFIACIFVLTIVLYTSSLLIIAGNAIAPIILVYLSYLPVLFILSIIYVLIYLSLSLLLSILIDEQAFALIAGVILIFIFDIITSVNVAGFLTNIISPDNLNTLDFIERLSPSGIMSFINHYLYVPNTTISIYSVELETMKLILYLVVIVILSYIAFIRRDIA
jgi:ABC-2 type transport system permease protein